MSDAELTALPNTKALLLIRVIYQEENKLKEITADTNVPLPMPLTRKKSTQVPRRRKHSL